MPSDVVAFTLVLVARPPGKVGCGQHRAAWGRAATASYKFVCRIPCSFHYKVTAANFQLLKFLK